MATELGPAEFRGFTGRDVPDLNVIRSCVHCGLCLPSCPTYRTTQRERSSPRGRIWLMKQVSQGKLDVLDPVFEEEMSLCLNCRACEAVCPSGVHYGEIVEASRAQIATKRPEGPRERLARGVVFDVLFTNPRRFRLANGALRLYQRSPLPELARRTGLLSRVGLAEAHELMPRMSDRFTVPRGQTIRAEGPKRGRVALFTGCIMSTAYAEVHEATIRVLALNGFDVTLVGDQCCCGALHVHGGDPDGGRKLARRNIDAFDNPYIDAVVVNAAGCGAQMKEYGHLLRDDPAYASRAKTFSSRVKDVTEFLAERGLAAEPGPLPMTVTYQEPCHLAHAQRITRQPRELLAAIPELRLVEMPESSLCCGSAGIYNLIQPEMANTLLARKLDNALSTGAEAIVSANPGCMLQLASGLRARGDTRPVLHLVEILDRAYRGAASAVDEPVAAD
ncbi:MAG TPA: heterodisulfide reductase-related iron-sulfur binding cluster [Thermomicrobiaceae bacterium]|nr:heterodisulfide reductase-related iron-sulfur binding cluster [Thermomicrobiaceae bacterium]